MHYAELWDDLLFRVDLQCDKKDIFTIFKSPCITWAFCTFNNCFKYCSSPPINFMSPLISWVNINVYCQELPSMNPKFFWKLAPVLGLKGVTHDPSLFLGLNKLRFLLGGRITILFIMTRRAARGHHRSISFFFYYYFYY